MDQFAVTRATDNRQQRSEHTRGVSKAGGDKEDMYTKGGGDGGIGVSNVETAEEKC
ncbi:hypothetical protein H2201_009333, partial [Coniosporium apollinis]